jgi:hypothetical protein
MECEAIRWRRHLTVAIQKACSPQGEAFPQPADGSQEQLDTAFDVLSGIVAEYRDGGDQITETCTCGQHA